MKDMLKNTVFYWFGGLAQRIPTSRQAVVFWFWFGGLALVLTHPPKGGCHTAKPTSRQNTALFKISGYPPLLGSFWLETFQNHTQRSLAVEVTNDRRV